MTISKIQQSTLLLVAFLLPIFFLPTNLVPLSLAKTGLLLVGLVVLVGCFLVATLRNGQVTLPWHLFFATVLLLPVIYFISGIFSTSSLSLFGYGLEVGTFASVLIGALLVLTVTLSVHEVRDVFRTLGAFFLSGALLALFGAVKVLSGGKLLTLGIFAGNMGNPIGSWTDYAIIFACLSLLSLLALEMLELRKGFRIFAYGVLTVSVLLLMVINFSVAWALLSILSLILIVYFNTMERRVEPEAHVRHFSSLTIALCIVSLLFLFNPSFGSHGDLRNFVSNRFGVQNLDVRPSLSATSAVSTPVLKAHPLLGSGPNTFSEDWLLYKSTDLNSTQFWNVSFPFGVGFVPTQIASTGVLGVLAWIAFIVFFVFLLMRSVSYAAGKRERFILLSTLTLSVFLLVSLFVYVPSPVVFYLTFFFIGLFAATAFHLGVFRSRTIFFANNPVLNFGAVLMIALVGVGIVSFSFLSAERGISVFYYDTALALASVPGASAEAVEVNVDKALALAKQDLYYRSLSEIALARAQAAMNATTGTDAENAQAFQSSLSQAITNAQAAISAHPQSYGDWIALGSIYAALVPAPLSVNGAYESAQQAYQEAEKRNPLTPEVPLLLARIDYDHGDIPAARKDLESAIALKADYAEAYFLLTQIEISQNDVAKAIASAKTAAILSPGNAGIFFELGLLEYSNKDYANSAQALAQAVTIVPTYANAKYFLGLSLDKLGSHKQALAQFSDLLKSNPDNTDLPVIIANINAGRDALYQAPSGNPVKKPTPPISSRVE